MSTSTITSLLPAGSRWTGPRRLAGLLGALALALILAFGSGTPGAGAQEPEAQLLPPSGSPRFPALTLTYTDAQGPGAATIVPQGPDPASGGTAIAVTIDQNGYHFTGSGFVRPGEQGGYVLWMTVTGTYGDSYELSGTLIHDWDAIRWRGRGRWWAAWNRGLTGAWTMAGGPFAGPAPRPELSTTVRLAPLAGSAVTGQVRLLALPEGETRFDLELRGLLPGKAYSVQLHAGTPGRRSASFTQVVRVHADAYGRATASGLVRFRGTEAIALLDIADGNHVITVVGFGQTVAVGSIPVLQPLG